MTLLRNASRVSGEQLGCEGSVSHREQAMGFWFWPGFCFVLYWFDLSDRGGSK